MQVVVNNQNNREGEHMVQIGFSWDTYFEGLHVVERQPEHRLLISIIVRAVYDLTLGSREDRRSAHDFFMNEEVSGDNFTFLWMCEHLNFDPSRFLAKYKESKVARGENLRVAMGVPLKYRRSKTCGTVHKDRRQSGSINVVRHNGRRYSASFKRRFRSSGFLEGKLAS